MGLIHYLIVYVRHDPIESVINTIFWLNIIAAGSNVMGWSRISNECQKIENALKAMVAAALNKGAVK